MNPYEEEQIYEEKLDNIVIELEELILDAMISALEKIRNRHQEYRELEKRKTASDCIPF